ncbi:hypothetical protein G1H11_17870 [Phytoactinopolyspora alkaliphila]|uniref:Secreted protein n=1 Tax=Phytoactinopolyspora alkaliphila TaxID=1783498 RepID=A0A6N9YQG3_9ACTN|nr:DUF5719 family protein [Phytoactinopolyspora alkaliphila]NED97170.1 hypothetical protein [Phytoactinopolyspora alkaliphila]
MRSGVAALTVVVAVAGTLGAASLVGPPDSVVEEHPEVEEPVVRTSLVCPFVGGEEEGRSHVGALALPGVSAVDDDEGPITARALGFVPEPGATPEPTPTDTAPPEPVFTLEERGVLDVNRIDMDEPTSIAVEGSGTLAPGLVAEQSLLVREIDLRGLSTTSCGPAAREHWFVGGSGEVGKRGRLVLANPTSVAAVVDVELWDEAGPLDAPATQGIGVPARSQQVLLLDALAPESERVGVRVTTSQGRVSAALEIRESEETTPLGFTFLPATVAPQERVVIPGVPGEGERVLRILAPGQTDAIVSMRVFGANGPFTPLDHEVVTVPSGSVYEVALDGIGEYPVGVELDSDEPVTASVRVVREADDGLPDLAFTAATPPLAGPAAALLGRSSSRFSTTVHVSSVIDSASRVSVAVLDGDGAVVSEEDVAVPAGATVPVEVEAPDDADFVTVVIDPSQADAVVVAREIVGADDDGAYLDIMPLWSPIVHVDVPRVVGELPGVLDPNVD